MRLVLLTVLLALLLLTWWALRPSAPPSAANAEAPANRVDYFVSGLDLVTYDERGLPLRRLRARRLDHFEGSGETQLEKPRLWIYQDARLLWKVTADSGTLSKDRRRLQLHDAVTLHRALTERLPAMQLQTRDVLVKPEKEYAETDAPVTITSRSDWIKAVGMRAWLRPPGKIHFQAHTRAYYVAE